MRTDVRVGQIRAFTCDARVNQSVILDNQGFIRYIFVFLQKRDTVFCCLFLKYVSCGEALFAVRSMHYENQCSIESIERSCIQMELIHNFIIARRRSRTVKDQDAKLRHAVNSLCITVQLNPNTTPLQYLMFIVLLALFCLITKRKEEKNHQWSGVMCGGKSLPRNLSFSQNSCLLFFFIPQQI